MGQNETLDRIEAAEARLGGVQAQVLALAELRRTIEQIHRTLNLTSEEVQRLSREVASVVPSHERRLGELQTMEASLAARETGLAEIGKKIAPAVEAAAQISAVAKALPDLEARAAALTAGESAVNALLSAIKRAEAAASRRQAELEDLDRRLDVKIRELQRLENSVASMSKAADALASTSRVCGELESRFASLQRAEARLMRLLEAREEKVSGGRNRRVI